MEVRRVLFRSRFVEGEGKRMAHPPFIEPQQTRSGGRCGEYRARTGWIESIEPRCIAQPDRDFRSHRQGGDDVAAAHIPLRLRDAESDGYEDRKSGGLGKSVSVRVDLGGGRSLKKKN